MEEGSGVLRRSPSFERNRNPRGREVDACEGILREVDATGMRKGVGGQERSKEMGFEGFQGRKSPPQCDEFVITEDMVQLACQNWIWKETSWS